VALHTSKVCKCKLKACQLAHAHSTAAGLHARLLNATANPCLFSFSRPSLWSPRQQRIPACFECTALGCKQPAAEAACDVRRAMGQEAEARYTAVSLMHWQRHGRQFACPACAHVASLDVQGDEAVVACPACGATACPTCCQRSHRGGTRGLCQAVFWWRVNIVAAFTAVHDA